MSDWMEKYYLQTVSFLTEKVSIYRWEWLQRTALSKGSLRPPGM
jgi:hypothetical protein